MRSSRCIISRTFTRKYIAKLAFKVECRALREADRTKIEERINFTRENYRLVRERLGQILRWKPEYRGKPPGYRDVNEAAKNIVMMDLAILQAEAAAGMYKKPIEVLAREVHYGPLSAEVRAIVIAAWTHGQLLPKVAIEEMVPVSTSPASWRLSEH
jgi:hypothetical protein